MHLEYKDLNDLDNAISKVTLANDGDDHERIFSVYINTRFSNYEKFWQKHIVPLTKRMELPLGHLNRVRLRDGISERMEKVTMAYYSVFMNLIQAYQRAIRPDLSWFEDFYTHLGSACDLAEDFWFRIYLLIIECESKQLQNMTLLSEQEFNKSYYQSYRKNYEHFQNKKETKAPIMIKVPDIDKILNGFFSNHNSSKEYRAYKDFTRRIREYRNVIIHRPKIAQAYIDAPLQIGNTTHTIRTVLVPRKEKINDYKTWGELTSVFKDTNKLGRDFINIKEQMVSDIEELEKTFNALWNVILQKMESLRNNLEYLKLQCISFSSSKN